MARPPETSPSSFTPTQTTSGQQPTVGRMVHFYPAGAEIMQPHSAVIAGIEADNRVTLQVLPPDGDVRRERGVPFSETPTIGAWSWPPRA